MIELESQGSSLPQPEAAVSVTKSQIDGHKRDVTGLGNNPG